VGDSIVIGGTLQNAQQDEVRTVLGISGRTITVAPLAFNHLTPSTTMPVYVAHLTRNAVIESETTVADRRGHVMFMHSRDVAIENAGFYRLGRTDKLQPINDPVVDSNWNLQPGTGTNPRARYPVHFHRNGLVYDGNPSVIRGSAVVDSPGWGFVNHSSYVDMIDNVAFDVDGAAFATEVGDEIGSFRGNIAIRMIGSGETTDSRVVIQDFGHQGDGFWFQGGGVSVTDNIAIGATGSGFMFYALGLEEGGVTKEFLTANLVNPSIADGAPTIPVSFVPIRQFEHNVASASEIGLTVRYHLRDAPHTARGTFENSTFWNNELGIELLYTHNTVLKNLTVVDASGTQPHTGIGYNAVTKSIVYQDLTVKGYIWGIDVAPQGDSIVSGGYFDNRHNIVIRTPISPNRSVTITGPITFVVWNPNLPHADEQTDVSMKADFAQDNKSTASAFHRNTVTLNYGPFVNRRAYFGVQHPLAIPFPTLLPELSPLHVGLTSLQLQALGKTISGELAPLTAVAVSRIDGLVGP
jgi:hypothetical protein